MDDVTEIIASMYFYGTVLIVVEHLESGGSEADAEAIVKDIYKRARKRVAETELLDLETLMRAEYITVRGLEELKED